MREIFTDKDYITGKLILFAKLLLILSLIVFFTPLFILPFFNHPCADDYICGYHLSNQGFWGYQLFIYNNWGGRFAATLTGSLFATDNYLYDHYYLHSLLLLLLNIASVFFMIAVLNKYVLKDASLQKNIVWVCLLFVALQVCSLAEPSTYIFWFSSAVTYQLPIILLQLQVGLWILVLHTDKVFARSLAYVLLPLLIFIINGFNELFIVVQTFLLLFMFLSKANRKLSRFLIAVIVIAFTASAFIVVLSPGIQSRIAIIEPKGILVGIVAVGYHIAEALWNIFRNPLMWVGVVAVYLYGNNKKEQFSHFSLMVMIDKKRWLMPVIIILFLTGAITIAVIGLKGGIIPGRYVNGVTNITVCLLLVLAFTEGILSGPMQLNMFSIKAQLLLTVVCFVGLLSNSYISDAYKSIISAPLYDTIMNEREALLKQAAAKKGTAELKSYDNAMHEQLQKDYSKSTKTLYDLVQQKPSFIFFEDDLATAYSIETLRRFYKADSLIVK